MSVKKDTFIQGFVPGQNHGSVDYTSVADGHVHYTEGYSGPAIPVGNGMHVHYYDFQTTTNDDHTHHVQGVDMPAPGTK
jgi:hypothetical protein